MKIRQFSLALITALNIGLNVSTKADAPNFNGGYVAAAAGANGMTTKVIFQDPTPEAISVDYGHTNVVDTIAIVPIAPVQSYPPCRLHLLVLSLGKRIRLLY